MFKRTLKEEVDIVKTFIDELEHSLTIQRDTEEWKRCNNHLRWLNYIATKEERQRMIDYVYIGDKK